MKEMEYEVVWPRGRKVVERAHLAKRLDTLQGKTVGFLWDWVFYGDKMFPVIEKELAKRYPGIRFVSYEMIGTAAKCWEEKHDEQLKELREWEKKTVDYDLLARIVELYKQKYGPLRVIRRNQQETQ